jgi:hypothetical protein
MLQGFEEARRSASRLRDQGAGIREQGNREQARSKGATRENKAGEGGSHPPRQAPRDRGQADGTYEEGSRDVFLEQGLSSNPRL